MLTITRKKKLSVGRREGSRDNFLMKFERNRYRIYFVQISYENDPLILLFLQFSYQNV